MYTATIYVCPPGRRTACACAIEQKYNCVIACARERVFMSVCGRRTGEGLQIIKDSQEQETISRWCERKQQRESVCVYLERVCVSTSRVCVCLPRRTSIMRTCVCILSSHVHMHHVCAIKQEYACVCACGRESISMWLCECLFWRRTAKTSCHVFAVWERVCVCLCTLAKDWTSMMSWPSSTK